MNTMWMPYSKKLRIIPVADELAERLRVPVHERGDRQRGDHQQAPAAPVVQRALVRDGQRADHEQVAADHEDVDGEHPDRDFVAEQRVQQLVRPKEALVDLPDADEDPAGQQRRIGYREDVFCYHGAGFTGPGFWPASGGGSG